MKSLILGLFMAVMTFTHVEAIKAFSINEALKLDSEESCLSVTGQARYRLEHRDNFDLNDSLMDEDAMSLWRIRLNVDVKASENLSFFTQLQFADVSDRDGGRNNQLTDDLDFRQAYVKASDILGRGVDVIVGRQELSYGNERLVGAVAWSNVGQSFDAFKIQRHSEDWDLDAFVARRQVNDRQELNSWSTAHDNFYGLYGSWKALNNHTWDAYYFYRDTRESFNLGGQTVSDMKESTLGTRFTGKGGACVSPNLDYTLETAVQWGDFGDQDIQAYMAVGILGYTFVDQPWQPRLSFEWSHASGDGDPSDGKRQTFDNLFPTNHKFYGYMDRLSLQNINDYKFGLDLKPSKKMKMKLHFHQFYVDEMEDAVYGASRSVLRNTNGNAGRHVGNELDFVVNYSVCNHLKLLAGYTYFDAADYLEDTGVADSGHFTYLQLLLSF